MTVSLDASGLFDFSSPAVYPSVAETQFPTTERAGKAERSMLYEALCRPDIANEPNRRRWFTDDFFDLFIWYDTNDKILGFQLCYGKPVNEHAFTWREGQGFTHKRVDDGDRCQRNAAEFLVPDGFFDWQRILARFREDSRNVDPDIVTLVTEKIRMFAKA